MSKPIQVQLVTEMEVNLERHGDSYLGVGWTKTKENADLRYQVMTDLVRDQRPCTLLDIGCGAAHLYEYMVDKGISHVAYSGLDLSPAYLALCRAKHPHLTFYGDDLLKPPVNVPEHDYVVMNGVFNYKGEYSFDEMWTYCQAMLIRAYALAKKGLAFNVVSKYVDWERDDLFHLPFDMVAAFLDQHLSRRFIIRHDYGLFEYTIHVYRSGDD